MKRPKVKRTHSPVRLPGGRIRIGTRQFGVAYEVEDDPDGVVWTLLRLMDGTREVDEIVNEAKARVPELDPESIREVINTLIAQGSVEDAAASPPTELSTLELERYTRNFHYFAWADTQPRSSRYEAQRRLKSSRVTVLGLGGSGSALAMSLAAAGVGSLHLVDGDSVELSNLNRQLLYNEHHIGRLKVDVAVEQLSMLNSHIEVTGQQLHVSSESDLIPLMERCDLFVLCADHPPESINGWTNNAALATATPWLSSAYFGPEIVIGIFVPFKTPCFDCIKHDHEPKDPIDEVLPGGASWLDTNAVIAPAAGLSGNLAALEAIYFLTDMHPQTVGRLFHQNLLHYDHVYWVEVPIWEDCPSCGPSSPHRKASPASEPAIQTQ